jgi:hypothetical protein
MAHFAKIENGVVTDLIVIGNDDLEGKDFPESEPIGQAFIAELAKGDPRLEGEWLQTSYNTRDGVHYGADGEPDNGNAFRLNFAQIGYTFDEKAGEYGEFYRDEDLSDGL